MIVVGTVALGVHLRAIAFPFIQLYGPCRGTECVTVPISTSLSKCRFGWVFQTSGFLAGQTLVGNSGKRFLVRARVERSGAYVQLNGDFGDPEPY